MQSEWKLNTLARKQRESWNGGLPEALGLGAGIGYVKEQTSRHGLHSWGWYAK